MWRSYSFKPFEPADFQAIQRLITQKLPDCAGVPYERLCAEDRAWPEKIMQRVKAGTAHGIAVKKKNELTGVLIYTLEENAAAVVQLILVTDKHQNRGLSAQVLTEFADNTKHTVDTFQIHATDSNVHASAVYARFVRKGLLTVLEHVDDDALGPRTIFEGKTATWAQRKAARRIGSLRINTPPSFLRYLPHAFTGFRQASALSASAPAR